MIEIDEEFRAHIQWDGSEPYDPDQDSFIDDQLYAQMMGWA